MMFDMQWENIHGESTVMHCTNININIVEPAPIDICHSFRCTLSRSLLEHRMCGLGLRLPLCRTVRQQQFGCNQCFYWVDWLKSRCTEQCYDASKISNFQSSFDISCNRMGYSFLSVLRSIHSIERYATKYSDFGLSSLFSVFFFLFFLFTLFYFVWYVSETISFKKKKKREKK